MWGHPGLGWPHIAFRASMAAGEGRTRSDVEHATYLKEIVEAYQAEVRGEATFSTLAEHATSAEETEVWRTLTRLESTTRQRLIPLLQRYGLDTTPDPERRRLGQERGKARAAAGFAATIKSMTETLLPYLTRYAQLQA